MIGWVNITGKVLSLCRDTALNPEYLHTHTHTHTRTHAHAHAHTHTHACTKKHTPFLSHSVAPSFLISNIIRLIFTHKHHFEFVCVCVCVWARERESDRERREIE